MMQVYLIILFCTCNEVLGRKFVLTIKAGFIIVYIIASSCQY